MNSPGSAAPAERRAGKSLPRHPLFLVLLAIIAAVAVYVQLTYIPINARVFGLFDNQVDLKVYRAGALHLLHGIPIYDGPIRGRFEYTYPPFSTVVLQPFGWMSMHAAVLVWSVLIVAALFWVVFGSFRALGYRADWRLAAMSVALVTVALLMEPVRTTIWYGQINVFLMAIVMWDLLRPDGSRLKGFSVGLAAGIKLTPGFFGLYLLATRRWKPAIIAAVTGLLTVVIGAAIIPRGSWKFWSDKIFDSQRVGPTRTPANQSIRGALARIFATEHPSGGLWVLISAVAIVIGLTAAYLAIRHGNEVLALALTGMTTTAVSPFSWGHHWVWFVPLLVVVVDFVLGALRDRRPLAAVGLLVLPVGLMLATFIWSFYLPDGALGLRPFYGIGTFMNPVPDWFRWFGTQPYICVFGLTALATIAVCLTRSTNGSSAEYARGPVDDGLGASSAVGPRR
ncbi:glycosyltransferase 87 family protein [Williamsia phyllosphaerae]|uniref:Polyprenol-phosphate-mannose-dependent alpha-(1-2)-phosphatidylinositol mannoside mannosyltransferase n=1 Tax=Williamsia phyllosphaerae TaxID=885042 RepID=A0ABQ1UJU0_9NOCA|nr:glycosyltransferase 87 family protein [Williamsia phyllosphaerae]GGF19629.1 hypothetical protein GCM10007298_14610 [Williamsia phyllosphaerae]